MGRYRGPTVFNCFIPPKDNRHAVSVKRTLLASALMILTMISLYVMSHSKNIKLIKPFSDFPREIGEWRGQEDRFDDKIYRMLGVHESFLGNYRSPEGHRIQLYVGYYENQQEGGLIHSPRNCMPGAGWNIIRSSSEELMVVGLAPGRVKITNLLIEKSGQRQQVLYWFQSRGRITASEYMQKFYLVLDSITSQRTDDSFVRLITPVKNGDENTSLRYLKDFAERLIPLLQEFIPS